MSAYQHSNNIRKENQKANHYCVIDANICDRSVILMNRMIYEHLALAVSDWTLSCQMVRIKCLVECAVKYRTCDTHASYSAR